MTTKPNTERRRKGFWIENPENSEPLFCFKPRHGGQKDVQKFTLKEIEKELEKATIQNRQ